MSTIAIDSKFSVRTGNLIPLELAFKMIEAHKSATVNDPDAVHSIFFGKEKLQLLLDHPDAAGLRFHFAKYEDGSAKLVIFPADEYGENLHVQTHSGVESALDCGVPCPPYCP